MDWNMPESTIMVRTRGDVLPLTPDNFAFRFQVDAHEPRYRHLSKLRSRLAMLGFTITTTPVFGVCAYAMVRRGRSPLHAGPMIDFAGDGARWLIRLTEMLEALKSLNAARRVPERTDDAEAEAI